MLYVNPLKIFKIIWPLNIFAANSKPKKANTIANAKIIRKLPPPLPKPMANEKIAYSLRL